jgi:hypothetical protein
MPGFVPGIRVSVVMPGTKPGMTEWHARVVLYIRSSPRKRGPRLA